MRESGCCEVQLPSEVKSPQLPLQAALNIVSKEKVSLVYMWAFAFISLGQRDFPAGSKRMSSDVALTPRVTALELADTHKYLGAALAPEMSPGASIQTTPCCSPSPSFNMGQGDFVPSRTEAGGMPR